MLKVKTTIKSIRNTDIPVTIFDAEKANCGLLLLVHGFKAERSEGNRFYEVAENLAQVGVSSICMGFAGCDESKEDFINYTLTNNLNDMESCLKYMLDSYSIDTNHLGMIGYSMGGRQTALFIKNHPEIKTIGLWAGAIYKDFGGENKDFLGGSVESMKKEANLKGYCEFLNSFDNETIKLNKELIDDMERYNPLIGLNSFTGNAIVCHGDKDITVALDVAYIAMDNLINAKNKELVIIKDANHGFGLWDNHMEQSNELVSKTTAFFKEYL